MPLTHCEITFRIGGDPGVASAKNDKIIFLAGSFCQHHEMISDAIIILSKNDSVENL